MSLNISFCAREEFLAWLGGGVPPECQKVSGERDIKAGLERHAVAIVWENDPYPPRSFDNPTLVVSATEQSDFFAWVVTYVSTFHPLTAFFRVVSEREIHLLLDEEEPELFRPTQIEEQLAALVVSEVSCRLPAGAAIERVPTVLCESSFSFAVLQAMNVGYSIDELPQISAHWNAAHRTIAEQNADSLSFSGDDEFLDDLLDFWISALRPEKVLSRMKKKRVAKGKRLAPEMALRSSDNRSSSDQLFDSHFSGTSLGNLSIEYVSNLNKEEQVRIFDEYVQILTSSRFDTMSSSCLLGYLAARISRGSIRYMDLLRNSSESPRMSVMWFTYFIASDVNFDGVSAYNGLGRRIVRRLLGFGNAYRLADVSLRELHSILKTDRLGDIRAENPPYIDVEIMPYIITKVRVGHLRKGAPSNFVASEISSAINEISSDLEKVLLRLHRLRGR